MWAVRNSKTKSRTSRYEQEDIDELDVTPVGEVPLINTSVIYGRSNTGKTTLASTWPAPILYQDVRDRGTASIADVKNIDVLRVNAFKDFEKAYWYLKQHPKEYKSVVIDTMSQLQQVAVGERARERHRDETRAGDWGTMTKQDWGAVSALMKEWIINYRDLADLGINVVFIAQDRTSDFDEDDEANNSQLVPEVGPALSPAIAKVLNASVNIIGNTFVRIKKPDDKKKGGKAKTQYCLRIGPNPVYVTKVRKPRTIVAPSIIVDPTYEDIMDIVKGD